MAKLVQMVLHKETGEKRLIKASRFNPEYHEHLDGVEGEVKNSKAGKNSTAAGIVVPDGTAQPKPAPVAPAPEVPAEPAPEVPAPPVAPEAPAEPAPEAPVDPEATPDPVAPTVNELVDGKSRKKLNDMALDLGHPEEDVLDAPNKRVVAEMIVSGEYVAPVA